MNWPRRPKFIEERTSAVLIAKEEDACSAPPARRIARQPLARPHRPDRCGLCVDAYTRMSAGIAAEAAIAIVSVVVRIATHPAPQVMATGIDYLPRPKSSSMRMGISIVALRGRDLRELEANGYIEMLDVHS